MTHLVEGVSINGVQPDNCNLSSEQTAKAANEPVSINGVQPDNCNNPWMVS